MCSISSRVQLFVTLRECSSSGSSVHGIFGARILECIVISSTRGSPRPRDRACISCVSCNAGRFFTAKPPGKLSFQWLDLSRGTDLFCIVFHEDPHILNFISPGTPAIFFAPHPAHASWVPTPAPAIPRSPPPLWVEPCSLHPFSCSVQHIK